MWKIIIGVIILVLGIAFSGYKYFTGEENKLYEQAKQLEAEGKIKEAHEVILKALGVEDFGIYNVVGGVVTLLGFLNGSLSGATSRFITFELGCGTVESLRKVFRCAVSIHYLLALFILIVAETVGLWFVLEKMVIPAERMTAALWVYQCSIITVLVFIISAPYNALIVAHERMGAFAYISIFEVVAKLLVVLLLTWVNSFDRLILYAVLQTGSP